MCSSPKETVLLEHIELPAKKSTTHKFLYTTPSNGKLHLVLRRGKYNKLTPTPKHITQECKKSGDKITEMANRYKNQKKEKYKAFDKHGKITKWGIKYIKWTRSHHIDLCLQNYTYGKISLSVKKEDGTYSSIINNSLISSASVMSKKIIMLNDRYGPFQKGTNLEIVLTTIVEDDHEYMNPPLQRKLSAVYGDNLDINGKDMGGYK